MGLQQATIDELIVLLRSNIEREDQCTICRELADRGSDAIPAVPALRELQKLPIEQSPSVGVGVELRSAALRAVWRITGEADDALDGLIAEFQQALAADPTEEFLELAALAEILKEMGNTSRDARRHLTTLLLEKYEDFFTGHGSGTLSYWDPSDLFRLIVILDRYTVPDIRKLIHVSQENGGDWWRIREVLEGPVSIPTADILEFICRSSDDDVHALLLEELGKRKNWDPPEALPAFKQAIRYEVDRLNAHTCLKLLESHPNTRIDDLLYLLDDSPMTDEFLEWKLISGIQERASGLSQGEIVAHLNSRKSAYSRSVIQSIIDDREKPNAGDPIPSTP